MERWNLCHRCCASSTVSGASSTTRRRARSPPALAHACDTSANCLASLVGAPGDGIAPYPRIRWCDGICTIAAAQAAPSPALHQPPRLRAYISVFEPRVEGSLRSRDTRDGLAPNPSGGSSTTWRPVRSPQPVAHRVEGSLRSRDTRDGFAPDRVRGPRAIIYSPLNSAASSTRVLTSRRS